MAKKYTNFLDLAKRRKTTYEFDTKKKIKKSDLNKILEAARWAPSCSNIQPWHFIVIKNKNTISKLLDISSYGAFHTDPKIIIAFVLDNKCWRFGEHRCVKDNQVGTYEAYINIAMPVAMTCLESEDIGISSAILSPNSKQIEKIFSIKKGYIIPIMVGLGYEKKGAYHKKRIRKSLKDIVSFEK